MDYDFQADIGANIRDFQREMREVDSLIRETALGADAMIGADLTDFQSRMQESERALEELREGAEAEIGADTAEFMSQAATVEAVTEAISTGDNDVEIGADISEAMTNIAVVEAATERLERDRITVRIRAAWTNYQNTMGAIAAFSRNFSEIVGMTSRGLKVMISPALVPVLASVVGLLGNLGPMLGTMGGSAFALATSFGAAGLGAAGFAAIAVPSITGVIDRANELNDLQDKMDKATTAKQYNKYLKEMQGVYEDMSKPQIAANKALREFKKTYSDMVSDMESPVLDIFADALVAINSVLAAARPMIENVTASIQNLMDSFNQNLKAADVKDFFSFLENSAGPAIETLGKAAGNFMMGLFNMMEAFGPLSVDTQNGFLAMSESFRKWADGLSESKKFQAFVDYVKENMPKIRSIFSDAIQGVINLFSGFGDSSSDMMTSLQDMMERFKEWSSTISQNKGFQNFIDYIKTNGPVVVSAIGNIVKFIVNLGIALAPVGEKILGLVTDFIKWMNSMMEAHSWIGKVVAAAVVLVGGLMAITPALLLGNALFGGLIATMVKFVAKTVWAVATTIARWTLMGVRATLNAIKIAAAWTFATGKAMVVAVAKMIASAVVFVARWTMIAAQATLNAIKVAAAWTLSTGIAMVTAVAKMIASAAVFVARWAFMGVQALLHAAKMAAAWLLAMGPIGWVTAAVLAIAALIIANWDKISAWTKKAWTAVSTVVTTAVALIMSWIETKFPALYNIIQSYMTMAKEVISAVWEGIKGTFSNVLSFLKSLVKGDFQGMKDAISNQMELAKSTISRVWDAVKSYLSTLLGTLRDKFDEMFGEIVEKVKDKMEEAVETVSDFVGEMPGKVVSFIDDMVQAGADLVSGVISGIKSKISEGLGVIGGLASSLISRFKKDTDTHSPSRAFADIAKWFAPGIVRGLNSTSGQALDAVSALSNNLTNAFNPQMAMADMRASATLDTSVSRADMGVVRKSFAAEIDSGEQKQQAIYVNNEIVGDKIVTVVNRGQAKKSRMTDGFYGK